MFHLVLAAEKVDDTLDMLVGEDVVVRLFPEEVLTTGVDEPRRGVALMLGEHQDADADGCAKKEVGRHGDYALHIVVLHQILPDLLLRAPTIEDAGEANDSCSPFGRKVAERMEHKGKVGFCIGRQHAGRGKARVVDERRVGLAYPAHGVGRIGDDGVEGFLSAVLRVEEGVAQGDVELFVADAV